MELMPRIKILETLFAVFRVGSNSSGTPFLYLAIMFPL